MKRKKRKNVDVLLFEQLRDCRSLGKKIEREDLVDGLITRLFAGTIKVELVHSLEFPPKGVSKYHSVLVK